MSSQRIGIVVVNYASAELIAEALDWTPPSDVEVVIVDNLSTEAERTRVTALSADRGWSLVAMPDNRGFGAGVNAGVARAVELDCACILLLNPDAVATPAVVDALRSAVLAEPTALIAPRLADAEGKITFAGSVLDLADGRTFGARSTRRRRRPLDWLTAACLAVHTDLWQRVGGFDESYFMYWEDVDFNYRCLSAGATTVLRDDLVVVHDQGGTQGPRAGRAKSSLYYFYNVRNRMLFAAKHLDRSEILSWLVRTPLISWEILLRGGRRQLLESPGRGWAAVRGAAAATGIGVAAYLGRRPRKQLRA